MGMKKPIKKKPARRPSTAGVRAALDALEQRTRTLQAISEHLGLSLTKFDSAHLAEIESAVRSMPPPSSVEFLEQQLPVIQFFDGAWKQLRGREGRLWLGSYWSEWLPRDWSCGGRLAQIVSGERADRNPNYRG